MGRLPINGADCQRQLKIVTFIGQKTPLIRKNLA
jgi:hypothetical protein